MSAAGRKGRTLRPEEQARVRAALAKLGETHTQEAIAEKIGFSQSTISSALNRRSGSSAWFAMEVARALGVPPSEILDFPTVDIPEMGVRDFLDWIYGQPALVEVVNRHRDVTIQDVFRLRATPARAGETDPSAAIYDHVVQLRAGDPVEHEVISPADLAKRMSNFVDKPGRKKRARTP